MFSAKRLDILLLHQEGEILAATHPYEAAARRNLGGAWARHDEAHDDFVQMQVRQLEQEADARFSQRQGPVFFGFPRKQIKFLRVSEKFWSRK